MYSLNRKVGQVFLFPDKGRGQTDYVALYYHRRITFKCWIFYILHNLCIAPRTAGYGQAVTLWHPHCLMRWSLQSRLIDDLRWPVNTRANLWHHRLDRDSDKIKHFREYLIWTPGITVSLDLLHIRVWVMIAFWKFLSGQLWLDRGDSNKVPIGWDWHMPLP